MTFPTGTLFVVATPIGNLSDMTVRAIEVLKSVDLIAAEDTRHSKKLLDHYDIQKKMIALHEHNEKDMHVKLLHKLLHGESIALISDAGTPLISDPGYILVKEARQKSVNVVPIPGCSAVIAALSASGMATDRFTFVGFLANTAQKRSNQLQELASRSETLVIYESCHRLAESIASMLEVFGAKRKICVAREITKIHEDFVYDTLEGTLEYFLTNQRKCSGEMVLIVEGDVVSKRTIDPEIEVLMAALIKECSLKSSVKVAAEYTGISKKLLYDFALTLKS